MADFEIKLNGAALEAALEDAFKDANLVFNRRAAQEIKSDKWYWPSGESPRDIVDKSGLVNSYVGTPIGKTAYDHAWTVDYAMAVHEGALFGAGDGPATGGYPSRPWTDEPVKKLPDDFEKLAKAKLGRVQ